MDPDHQEPFQSPFNSIPLAVIVLTVLILGIELVLQLAEFGILGGPRGVGWRIAAIEEYGFSSAVLDRVLVNGDYSFEMLRRFVTYPFINVQLTGVAFCAGLTLALGKFAGEFYGGARVLFIYLFSAVVGAVLFGLLVDGRYPLIGGYTPVYGLIGAYTYALWIQMGQAGERQINAFRLIGFLLMLQLIFGLFFGSSSDWISHLSGFAAGFVISVVLAPGGWALLLARLRKRS